MTNTTIVYIVTGVVVLVGAMWLLSRAISSGKKIPTPPPANMQTYDQVVEEQQEKAAEAERDSAGNAGPQA